MSWLTTLGHVTQSQRPQLGGKGCLACAFDLGFDLPMRFQHRRARPHFRDATLARLLDEPAYAYGKLIIEQRQAAALKQHPHRRRRK
jgi:hypothetical protein